MRQRRPVIIALAVALAVVLVGVWVAWRVSRPVVATVGHKVSITFMGFTNDPAGGRQARFVVSNLHSAPIERRALFWTRTATNGTGTVITPYSRLRLGASETFIVPAPPRQDFRLSIHYYSNGKLTRMFYTLANLGRAALGEDVRYRTMPYGVDSDWIEQDGNSPTTERHGLPTKAE